MADGLNQKINDHDSISTILSSDNFLNLDANIQNKIIDTVHTDKEKDGGTMGKFLGGISKTLHDPFSPGPSIATEAAPSPMAFHGLSQYQDSAVLHDPFMPSTPVPE